MSSILSEAVEDELIPANPVRELRTKRRSKQKTGTRRRIDPFTADELAILMQTARTHTIVRHGKRLQPYRAHYPFLLLLARTGLRLSEAIGLRWGDIDWVGNRIHVERAWVLGEEAPPKSGKDRHVDMSDELKATLRACYRERFEQVVAIDAEAEAALEVERAGALEALVFPDSDGGHLDDHNLRRRLWAPLLVAAELRTRRCTTCDTASPACSCKTAPSCSTYRSSLGITARRSPSSATGTCCHAIAAASSIASTRGHPRAPQRHPRPEPPFHR